MVNTPFNYTGSKFKLLSQILPLFDYTKKHFIDLFAGGGSVYANVIDKYDTVEINDIIGPLVGIHQAILNDDAFVERVKSLCVTKTDKPGYVVLREGFNQSPTPEGLFALMLCCTNNLMRFNKKFQFNQTFGERTFNPNTQKKIDEFVAHLKPHKDKITYRSCHFAQIKPTSPSMIYIDPPYGLATDGSFISEAGYNAYWSKDDDANLYHYIKEIAAEHSFLLSGLLEHNGKKSWLLSKLIEENFNYRVLDKDYEKVARNKNKNSVEIVVGNVSF